MFRKRRQHLMLLLLGSILAVGTTVLMTKPGYFRGLLQHILEPQEVLIARGPIAIGTGFTEPKRHFQKTLLLFSKAPPNAVRDYSELKYRMVRRDMLAGEPISRDDLLVPCGRPMLPAGLSAIGMRLDRIPTTISSVKVDLVTFMPEPEILSDGAEMFTNDVPGNRVTLLIREKHRQRILAAREGCDIFLFPRGTILCNRPTDSLKKQAIAISYVFHWEDPVTDMTDGWNRHTPER